ncbi:uncharacterized protein BDR25DRAFT_46339 [Lindgomyces ingoldianus]|uniref:Uncharacterized protein n=1 Tax=Lindgomyces ingoldianus TaxID=673940 RepID=A0ACB6QSV1_9PLEO|nr:uncharacterized protein BDR25DRAFT_46339 [Lindgomyces ingoldianus]KAF2469600.1 hypothetical protein BDR25DRAFT_46339 [Lindgomyces ingoldianus]
MGKIKIDRQVSIEFIEFGDDQETHERLRRLDDDMPFRGVSDMIDTEKFSVTSNISTMLLGLLVEAMDMLNDDSLEHLSTIDDTESSPLQTTGPTQVNTLPLRSISEESNGSSFSSSTASMHYTQQTLPSLPSPPFSPQQAQPKAKNNRLSVPSFLSRS